MGPSTDTTRLRTISKWDEIFHVMAATAALFGYPPPPPPRTLKSMPEWNEYVARRGLDNLALPDTEFYRDSPYCVEMVREEARTALRILRHRIGTCKNNQDKQGQAGLEYLHQTIRLFLSKVEYVPETVSFWDRVPILNRILKSRRKKKEQWESALKAVDTRMKSRGYAMKSEQREMEESQFFKANEKELKVIYHTLRGYILDENISIANEELHRSQSSLHLRFNVQKETASSSEEAFEFNRWLGLFFSNLFQEEKKGRR